MRHVIIPTGFLLLLVLSMTACATRSDDPGGGEHESMVTIPFRADGTLSIYRDDASVVDMTIEIADDDSTRTRGLMQRKGLPDRSGMLFIFPVEEYQSFWMANTQMSLDLLFIDSPGRIVSIARYAKPLSTEPVASLQPAQYVLEVEAGFVDTWGVVEGDSIRWARNEP